MYSTKNLCLYCCAVKQQLIKKFEGLCLCHSVMIQPILDTFLFFFNWLSQSFELMQIVANLK